VGPPTGGPADRVVTRFGTLFPDRNAGGGGRGLPRPYGERRPHGPGATIDARPWSDPRRPRLARDLAGPHVVVAGTARGPTVGPKFMRNTLPG